MKTIDVEQRSPEWRRSRAGIPTASEMDKLITSTGKTSTQRTKYMYRLAGEQLGAIPEDTYQSPAMKRGIELEPDAILIYEYLTGQEVVKHGFCVHDEGNCGCSPDGLVGEDGIVQIKCPSLAVHVEYLLGGVLPTDYKQQVFCELLVTGRKWEDFFSFYPGIKPFTIRIFRDETYIAQMKREVDIFVKELNELVEKLK